MVEKLAAPMSGVQRVLIHKNVTRIATNAFRDWANLAEVVIPVDACLEQICDGAFAGCKNLKKVVLNERLETIGKKNGVGAFQDSGLEEIYLPPRLRNMDVNTFSGCGALKTVEVADGCTVKAENYVGPAVQIWHVTPRAPPAAELVGTSKPKSGISTAEATA